MRDITLEDTAYFNFTTRAFTTGVPTVLAGTPALSVLESNNATPITAGVSVDLDRATVVGLNQATVVATAANGYEAGKSYAAYISTGTVGGVSVVGEVVAEFTVQASAAFTRLGAPAGASVSADVAAAKVDTAAIKVKTDFLPSVTAGGAGGVFIAGTNAATTITTALTTTFTGNLTGSVGSVTAFSAAAIQSIWDALTSALTTAGSIGKWILDKLDVVVSGRMATYTQPTGFLAATFPGGTVASSAEVVAIQNNTRVVRVVPDVVERPDSGTTTYRVELLLYDDTGNMEAPDSAPTIALVNQAGTDLIARLDFAGTMQFVSTGRYRSIYTASVGDALEQLVWTFSVIEGGATRVYGNNSLIVDTTAVDFTAADRTKLETLATDYTTARAVKIDHLDADISSRGTGTAIDAAGVRTAVGLASANLDTQLDALPTNTELATALGTADDATLAQIALVKAKTDNLPVDPADASDVTAAVAAVLTTALADVYAANGVAPTLQQAIMAIHQAMFDFSITSTTIAVEKLAGTSAFDITLDSATLPTAAHRA